MFEKGREKNKVEGQGIIRRRGEGLGTGKVGNENAGKTISNLNINIRQKPGNALGGLFGILKRDRNHSGKDSGSSE